MAKYPHLNDTSFPNAGNVDVFKYENNFDYAAFDDIQMTIKLISVPWDLGEVHVGLKSIPMGNVVGWSSRAERDAWLDAQEGETYTTKYRSYHNDDVIKLPIPYEYAQYRNYIVVDYSRPPVDGTDGEGIGRWLYFLRDIKKSSMSTTEATVQIDGWSMFINDIDFSHMVLERGHYAMAKAAKVDEYLSAPIDNTAYLMTPDISYGSPSRVKELGFINEQDGDNCYVIACTANPESDAWGSYNTDGWKIVPQGNAHYEQQTPSYFCFAIETDSISDFWANVYEQTPQFMATVKCVYLVSKSLVYYEKDFRFCGITCHLLHRGNVSAEFGDLSRDLFDYGRYSEITKLYTSPYCHIEVTDGEGATTEINVEDCASGTLKAYRYLSIAYPYASVKSYLAGVGDGTSRKVTYTEITARNFHYSGKWWDTIWEHDIPTYAIVERPYKANEYAGWYDRKANKENVYRSAETSVENASTGNAASVNVTANNATLATKLADLKSGDDGLNKTLTKKANELLASNLEKDKSVNTKNTYIASTSTLRMATSESAAALQTASLSANAITQTAANSANAGLGIAAISGAAGVMSAGVSMQTGAASALLTGGPMAAAGAQLSGAGNMMSSGISALTGMATAGVEAWVTNTNASIQAATTMSTAQTAAGLKNSIATLVADFNEDGRQVAEDAMVSKESYQETYNNAVTNNTCKMDIAATKLNTSNSKANAQIMADAGNATAANSSKTQKANCDVSIQASLDSARMQAPIEHGSYTGGSGAVKPRGLWANVVTQPDDAIAQAGIEMLRFGYAWDGDVDFETFNVMTKFSYWKVKDIWASASHLPDAWVDYIRNYLLEGVTVWAKPEYINKVSIYDNATA